jgi:hypothetical protein
MSKSKSHNRSQESMATTDGRSGHVLRTVGILAAAGSDLLAFKSALDLQLRASEAESFAFAGCLTVAALGFAWAMGLLFAHYRHGHSKASLVGSTFIGILLIAVAAGVWKVRTAVASSGENTYFGQATAHSTGGAQGLALIFAAMFFLGCFCAAFEAYSRANTAAKLRQLDKKVADQRELVARLRGEVERAKLTSAHHAAEYDRDEQRRQEALAEREALGAHLKNLARVLMASKQDDPRQTDVTLDGPDFAPKLALVEPQSGEQDEEDDGPDDAQMPA